MCSMDFEHVVAGGICALGRGGEFPHQLLDLGGRQRTGLQPAFGGGEIGRTDHFPFLPAGTRRPEFAALVEGARRRSLAPRMGDLGGRQHALAADEIGQPLVARDLAIVPESEIALRDAASRLHGAILGEHDSELAQRELAEMDEVEIVHQPVRRAELDHGRNDGPIGRRDAAHLERREEKRFLQRSVPRTRWLIEDRT